jgi:hypothetical protein
MTTSDLGVDMVSGASKIYGDAVDAGEKRCDSVLFSNGREGHVNAAQVVRIFNNKIRQTPLTSRRAAGLLGACPSLSPPLSGNSGA